MTLQNYVNPFDFQVFAFAGFLRATTALHAASSAGAVAVLRRLIEARAAVAGGHGQLRALTPLHDAGTEEVALLLRGFCCRVCPGWFGDTVID